VANRCLASLVHQADFLLDCLPINHPLLVSTILTNPSVLDDLREHGDSKWMEGTGIPPHIELYKNCIISKRRLTRFRAFLSSVWKKYWKERCSC
ncbi:hypothetical protein PHYSODRAFT_535844, partial [Phytophthora sojae]